VNTCHPLPTDVSNYLETWMKDRPDLDYPIEFGEEVVSEEELRKKQKRQKPLDISEETCVAMVPTSYISGLNNEIISNFIGSLGYKSAVLSNYIYYYPKACMGWHTNYMNPGKRLYIIKNYSSDSYFVYEKDGKVIKDIEPSGYCYREFELGDEDSLFWHAVYGGQKGRYSVGFKVY